MSLSQSDLSSKLQANLSGVFTILNSVELKKVCDAIAQAVVDEITQNAIVTGTVTSGAGQGGSVTGTVQ